jgi:hypothetical protein
MTPGIRSLGFALGDDVVVASGARMRQCPGVTNAVLWCVGAAATLKETMSIDNGGATMVETKRSYSVLTQTVFQHIF